MGGDFRGEDCSVPPVWAERQAREHILGLVTPSGGIRFLSDDERNGGPGDLHVLPGGGAVVQGGGGHVVHYDDDGDSRVSRRQQKKQNHLLLVQ